MNDYWSAAYNNIQEIIHKEYGFSIANIEKLNSGFDANTMVFKVSSTEQKEYFLKIRSKYFTESCINVPFWLSKKAGLANIIDPLETMDKKLYVKTSSSYIMMYPYINGKSGWDVSLTKEQFIDYGRFMYKLHSVNLPNDCLKTIPMDKYNRKHIETVKKYLKNHKRRLSNDSVIMDFSTALETNQSAINEIIHYLENTVETSREKICLCHGDINAGNLLLSENNLYIVDWDTLVLASKEKDLMYIGGGIGNKWNNDVDVEYFYKGYGQEIEIDKKLIKYYRCKRIIQDIFYFVKEINDFKYGNDRRNDVLRVFKSLFESMNVVEMALKT
jgi:spectinomycin phosphotransferase